MDVTAVVADESTLLREGLARLLVEAGVAVPAVAGDVNQTLSAVDRYRPDVVVIDVHLPPSRTDEGLRTAGELRRRHPHLGILVLSQSVRVSYVERLVAIGPHGVGYLVRARVSTVDELVTAVRRVAAGGSVLDPVALGLLAGRRGSAGRSGRTADLLHGLTVRERDILALVAEGRSNQAIASRLAIAERTVEKHCTSIFDKLQLPADREHHRRILAALHYLHA